MINLIPPHGKVALSHEYILRVSTVYGFLLGGLLVVATAFTFPTYILLESQIGSASVEGSRIEEKKAEFERSFTELRKANTLMAQLHTNDGGRAISDVITEVIRVAPEGVLFSSFAVTREGGEITSVTIGGEAPTRSHLARLKTNIEESPLFLSANLPISDLAKESKLPFVISATLETPPATP